MKFKVAVIGLGLIGMKNGFDTKRKQPASHIAAIKKNKNLELVAVCDPDPQTRNKFSTEYGNDCQVFSDYKELIINLGIDKNETSIIVIATPDSTHSTILEELLDICKERNSPLIIFCEKPITPDIESATKIRNMLNNKNVKIVVNHIRRWSKMWKEANHISKQIGEIKKAAFYFSSSPENKELSQIRDGIHIADVINWFEIGGKTSVNRIMLPYFINAFYLWGSEGKIEILNYDQVLNYYKVKESERFSGFKELELVRATRYDESLIANSYEEFVSYLNGKIDSLSTDLDDAIDSLTFFEKYVYDSTIAEMGSQK